MASCCCCCCLPLMVPAGGCGEDDSCLTLRRLTSPDGDPPASNRPRVPSRVGFKPLALVLAWICTINHFSLWLDSAARIFSASSFMSERCCGDLCCDDVILWSFGQPDHRGRGFPSQHHTLCLLRAFIPSFPPSCLPRGSNRLTVGPSRSGLVIFPFICC